MKSYRLKLAKPLSLAAVVSLAFVSLVVPAYATPVEAGTWDNEDVVDVDVDVRDSTSDYESDSTGDTGQSDVATEVPTPPTDEDGVAQDTLDSRAENTSSDLIDYETEIGGDPSVLGHDNYFADVPVEVVSRAVAAAGFDAQRAIANWMPGFILSDHAMYSPSLMSESQVKSFIQTKGANCTSSSSGTCLKDKTASALSLQSKFADKGYGCKPLKLAAGTKSWTAVKSVGDACGINPQILLVFIQKESSGLTQALSNARWDKMMGMGCPDGQPCKTEYAGFTNQLYYGADALTSYRYRDFKYNNAAKAGTPIAVPYSSGDPTGCGSETFVIENQATASLYTYNPAVPSKAALAAYPGYTANPCDSWGQRNVYMFMMQWFPETMVDHPGVTPRDFTSLPKPTVAGLPFVGSSVSVRGGAVSNFTPSATSVSYQWFRDGQAISGATKASYPVASADMGKKLTVRVGGSRLGYNSASATSAAVAVKGTLTRLAGADRYKTNVAVNQKSMFAGKPLFVATGGEFADALSAGPAVSLAGGSLILTTKDSVPADALALVKSKKPSAVYILGGKGAVSDEVMTSLASATGVTPQRVGGADRYETSANILETFFAGRSVPKVFLATGSGYPDALSASAAGGALGMPVLLVNGETGAVHDSAVSFLQSKGTKTLVVVGGKGAVAEPAVEEVKSATKATTVQRLSGSDRYATNLAVNNYIAASDTAVEKIWIATGRKFPDALSAAVPAGALKHRLVLSPGLCIPKPVLSKWIGASTSKVTNLTLVGGVGALVDGIEGNAECP